MRTLSFTLAHLPALAFLVWNSYSAGSQPPMQQTNPSQVFIGPSEGADGKINDAITRLPRSGGTVTLGAGVFEVHHPVVINHSGVRLKGQGKSTILRLANNANCPVLIIGHIYTPAPNIVNNVIVEQLSIDGNRRNQTIECWGGDCDTGGQTYIRNNCLTIRAAKDVLISEIETKGARSGGVVLEKGCRDININKLESHDNFFDGLAAYESESCTFKKLNLHHNRSAALSFDLKFNRNIIEDSSLANNGSQGIFMRDSSENTFRNTLICKNGQEGIFIAQIDRDENTGCNANVFQSLRITQNAANGVRINDKSCSGNVFRQCTIAGNGIGEVSEAQENLLLYDLTEGK